MGKAKNRRHCPALNSDITPSECGENRQSRHVCTADCSFNPFSEGNYDTLMEIEGALDQRSMVLWMEENAGRPETLQTMQKALNGSSPHARHAAVVWRLFFQRGADGSTFAQRWAARKFPGLQNDARVLFKAKMQLRVVLLEIHRVLDDQRLEAVDLLSPGEPPMIFVDRSLASRAVRFTTLLGWAFPLPHFWRMNGTAMSVVEVDDMGPREILMETVKHLGGPEDPAQLRLWLAEHFANVSESFAATGGERHRKMIANVDLHSGKATYGLHVPYAEVRAALDADPEVAEGEISEPERGDGFSEARDWFDDASSTKFGRKLLGRVLLGQASLRVEAMSRVRFASLRERFEKRLGERVNFENELWEDMAKQLTRDPTPMDLSLVPPRLVETPKQLAMDTYRYADPLPDGTREDREAYFLREQLRDYADQPLPALGEKTPREAVADPQLREKVCALVRQLVTRVDELNLSTGRSDDINFLLRDLGLTELDFPPPPRRVSPREDEWEQDVEEGDAELDDLDFDEAESDRDTYSKHPGKLTKGQVHEYMERALSGFPTAASAMNELVASGSTLMEDADDLSESLLNNSELSFLLTFLMHGWFTLVEPGTRAPELDYERMEEEVDDELEKIPSWTRGGSDAMMDTIAKGCRQPELLKHLVAELFEGADNAPKELRPRTDALVKMIVIIKAVLNEVDRSLAVG